MDAPSNSPHISVLYNEILTALNPRTDGKYIDGTLGAGGHTAGILRVSSPYGQVLGLDIDPDALQIASEKLAVYGSRVHLRQNSYTNMAAEAKALGWNSVQGIVLDLGASSMQFDQKERGFSFMETGPLDMRFNPDADPKASDLINNLPQDELANIIYEYGEEKASRRIARLIVANRPLHSTKELADLIQKHMGSYKARIHPATRTFQALRIAVNDELNSISRVLPTAIDLLEENGVLAVISFHSLEDRIVKNVFREAAKTCECPPELPFCSCDKEALIQRVTKKPLTAADNEVADNPRARSAKLRVVRKL